MLAFDGAWRSGHSPEQIVEAYAAKLAKNEKRVWPDWRTADPNKAIEHTRTTKGGVVIESECAYCGSVNGGHTSVCSAIRESLAAQPQGERQ
jgi:hypothetical protein